MEVAGDGVKYIEFCTDRFQDDGVFNFVPVVFVL